MIEILEASSPHSTPAIPDVTGWLLTEAQAALRESGCDLSVRLIETGPPQKAQKRAPEYSEEPSKSRKPARAPIAFGDWRVLRCRQIEDEPILELLIAREQRAAA